MTRLTEAIERAQTGGASAPADPGVARAVDTAVVGAWQLDKRHAIPPADVVPSEPMVGAAVAGAMPYPFRASMAEKLVVGEGAAVGLIEQYRRLAAGMHHAQTQRGAHSVMIASAVAAEGKSLTATNLALTLSQSFNRRVLLIDADLRRPSLHETFQLPNDVGLVDSLRQSGGPLPVRAVLPHLWVLVAGRPTSDPMSGLVSDAMKQLLAEASEQFDWVIVDTPPVALMPDANLLAGMIDTALLVVSANTTPYPLVQRAAAAIGTSRILGVVLNRASQSALEEEYGYYGSYDRAPRSTQLPRRGLFSRLRNKQQI